MNKQQLRFQIELDFSLVGMSCHLKDYRFIWLLNKILHVDFTKKKTPLLDYNNSCFSQFEYLIDVSTAYIFANRGPTGYLVKEKKQVDYWLKLEEPENERTNNWIKEIRTIPQVLVAYEENLEKIKEQFIF